MLYEPNSWHGPWHGRSLSGLMELYELNFVRLARLISDLDAICDEAVSRVDGSPALHLQVLERGPFTTTLCLTYRFEESDGVVLPDPDLRVRVYHDARLAEAMSCRSRPGVGSLPPQFATKLPLLDWKLEINRFLEKWLTYCLAQGHRFARSHADAISLART
jgi:uncharacterized protein